MFSSNFHAVLRSPNGFPDWKKRHVYEAFFFSCFHGIFQSNRNKIISGAFADTRFPQSLDCIFKEWSRHPVACYLLTAKKPSVSPHVQRNMNFSEIRTSDLRESAGILTFSGNITSPSSYLRAISTKCHKNISFV